MTRECLPLTISQLIRYKTAAVNVYYHNITPRGYLAAFATLSIM